MTFMPAHTLVARRALQRQSLAFGRLSVEAKRRECRRAGAVLVRNNRETEVADRKEIEALFFALVGPLPPGLKVYS
jgi:hypothetical protein